MLAYVDNRRLARNSDFGGLINLASFSVSKFLTQTQSCCDLAPQRLTVRVAQMEQAPTPLLLCPGAETP
ncbi:MAG: hypothetical protein V7L05_08180 [Nostoc sp.]|uniref:hypothetical protein n=1 Tax=Nostoc sp. TaxID=1180 RepID=UPI002FF8C6AC